MYFSVPDPLELHPFICLAILTTCKEALEELDQSEIRSMLLSLPVMEIDRVSTSRTAPEVTDSLVRSDSRRGYESEVSVSDERRAK